MSAGKQTDVLKRIDSMLKRGTQRQAEESRTEPLYRETRPPSKLGESLERMVIVRAGLHWGFVVRMPGASAAQLALPLAPPTSVIGAIASPLFRLLGLREKAVAGKRAIPVLDPHFECSLRATRAAGMGVAPSAKTTGICVYQEISRVIAAPYKAGGGWDEALRQKTYSLGFYTRFVTEAMPVQAVGAAYAPGVEVDLAWVFDAATLASCLREKGVKVSPEDIDNVGELAAYGVSRLGSKEGIVSVVAASYLKSGFRRVYRKEVFSTHIYVPVSCVRHLAGAVSVIKLWDIAYKPVDVYVPGPATNALVTSPWPGATPQYEITSDCVAYVAGFENTDVALVSQTLTTS